MTSSYLFLNDLRVHYLHWNLGSGGRPVVLLHGLASNARIWEQVAVNLAAARLQVLAPDGRGHGLTDRPDGDYSFDIFFRDLTAFIDACDLENPLLVGHSWGAGVALDYAARLSLGRRAPAGLVLVDGGTIQVDQIPGATWESTRQLLAPPKLAGTPLEAFLEQVQASNSRWQPDEAALKTILANFEIAADETISPRLSYEHHMQIVRAMWEFQTYERYDRLRCPVLIVPARPAPPYGEREGEFLAVKERSIRYLGERFPAVQVRWMEDTVHDIPLQRPAELSQLIVDFAAGLPDRA